MQEPLAFWIVCTAIVAFIAAVWSGYHAESKARREVDDEWRSALKWADRIHRYGRHPRMSDEQWAKAHAHAAEIRIGRGWRTAGTDWWG